MRYYRGEKWVKVKGNWEKIEEMWESKENIYILTDMSLIKTKKGEC